MALHLAVPEERDVTTDALFRESIESLLPQCDAAPVDIDTSQGSSDRLIAYLMEDLHRHLDYEKGLKDALTRSEIGFVELQHRVKNLLQMLNSLIMLQATRAKDFGARRALQTVASRVGAITHVYRQIDGLSHASRVDLPELVAGIVDAAKHLVADEARIEFHVKLPPVCVPGHVATPLALIVNEIVTNACKYAFVHGKRGTVTVRGVQDVDRLVLEIVDDGVGFGSASVDGDDGLGVLLMNALAKQLQATLTRLPLTRGTGYCLDMPIET